MDESEGSKMGMQNLGNKKYFFGESSKKHIIYGIMDFYYYYFKLNG